MKISTTALHPRFGVEIHDVDLLDAKAEYLYPEIRSAFERYSLLLFRKQNLDVESHLALAGFFGPIENREKGAWGIVPSEVSKVSNLNDEDELVAETDSHLLHLRANQLWHTDSTFLPVPALANILTARVVSSRGGETELVSTRAAWRDMPQALKSRATDAIFWHRYAHSRAQIDPALASESLFTMWPDQAWRAVWPNPVTGEEALYIASHAFAVKDMDEAAGQFLIRRLIEFATQNQYIYSHAWQAGDVLIWDERATLHRGRPWPYHEERTLASLCVSASENDGLDSVRPVSAN
jgi:alpha-ketoglutarate-dependent 2,4-dichlorophenoxyacetate dioxygenase